MIMLIRVRGGVHCIDALYGSLTVLCDVRCVVLCAVCFVEEHPWSTPVQLVRASFALRLALGIVLLALVPRHHSRERQSCSALLAPPH